MAWMARVASDIIASDDNRLMVSIEFFDDAAPTEVLHRRTWTLDVGTTTGQLQSAVLREGQAARAAAAGAAAARQAVPAGTTVAIP